jgi:hypothetical protein
MVFLLLLSSIMGIFVFVQMRERERESCRCMPHTSQLLRRLRFDHDYTTSFDPSHRPFPSWVAHVW